MGPQPIAQVDGVPAYRGSPQQQFSGSAAGGCFSAASLNTNSRAARDRRADLCHWASSAALSHEIHPESQERSGMRCIIPAAFLRWKFAMRKNLVLAMSIGALALPLASCNEPQDKIAVAQTYGPSPVLAVTRAFDHSDDRYRDP